jgi:hypothetical protein
MWSRRSESGFGDVDVDDQDTLHVFAGIYVSFEHLEFGMECSPPSDKHFFIFMAFLGSWSYLFLKFEPASCYTS